jgi:hypothetical protein
VYVCPPVIEFNIVEISTVYVGTCGDTPVDLLLEASTSVKL